MTRIFLTGGGSAGHVTPNLALVPYLRKRFPNIDIHYVGSENGIERDIIAQEKDITYHAIRTGKLRRYMSLKNLTDPFRVIGGYFDSKKLVNEYKPNIVFSKGGFVSVPLLAAAAHYKIPVISHESDYTPGLANKIAKRYATKICVTFPDTLKFIGDKKGVCTGTPIRSSLLNGNAEKARIRLLLDKKPVLLMMGGSLGSRSINNVLRQALPRLTEKFNIIHLCGKGNIDASLSSDPDISKSYKQFEFLTEELPDILALADIVISRAGSNSIHEFLALKKPMLLIPLPLSASRGDQILNAESFERRGLALVLTEENMTSTSLTTAINVLSKEKEKYINAMSSQACSNGVEEIVNIISSSLITT